MISFDQEPINRLYKKSIDKPTITEYFSSVFFKPDMFHQSKHSLSRGQFNKLGNARTKN